MELIIETKTYKLWENERGDILLEHKTRKEFSGFLTGDPKFFIRELLAK